MSSIATIDGCPDLLLITCAGRFFILWYIRFKYEKYLIAMTEITLYEKIGGEEAVTRMVDAFYHRVLTDKDLAEFFKNTPIQRLKNMQKEFFTIALGGPGEYSGLSLSHAHQGRGIYTKHFQAFVGHLLDTLNELDLTEQERYQIISDVNLFVEDVADDSAASIN